MFVVTVWFDILPSRMNEFLPLIRENARRSIADEPGCRQFDVICPEGGSDTVVFYEVYDSRAAFDAHLETPHLERFRQAFPPLIIEERPVRFAERQHP